jgi:glycine betaine transporter
MVWWDRLGPFVGVFVARISYGRTIREFLLGVLIGPTLFSVIWFGVFGGIGLYETLDGAGELVQATQQNVERVTFVLLERLPFSTATTLATVAAAFLFLVTSVVSAAFVLGTYATGGDPNPPARLRLVWGVVLGGAGLCDGAVGLGPGGAPGDRARCPALCVHHRAAAGLPRPGPAPGGRRC